MAGLMSGATPQPTDDMDEEPNVSPEEQAQYEHFVDSGLKLLFSPKSFKGVMQRLTSSDDPVEGLASTVVMAVQRVSEVAEKAGTKISPDVQFHGAKELLEGLADAAAKAGVHDYSEDEMEAAFLRGMDMYRQIAESSGKLHKDALKGDMEMLMRADKEGRLGEVIGEEAVSRYSQIGEQAAQQEQRGGAPAPAPTQAGR